MPQVGDEAAGQPRIGQRLAGHAGLAVVHRPLAVEQVGDHARAGVHRRGHLRGRGVAVTHADQHACLGEPGDGGERAVELGSEGDHPEQARPRREQGVDRGRRRLGDPLGVVRALAAGGDERPLDVHAEQPGTARQAGPQRERRAQRGGQPVQGRGDDRGQERGRAGLGQAADDRGPPGRVGSVELLAEVPVDLEIHETRDEQAAAKLEVGRAGRRPGADRGDAAARDADEAGFQHARACGTRYQARGGQQ